MRRIVCLVVSTGIAFGRPRRKRVRQTRLEDLIAADQCAQALVLLTAGRAAGEVCPQARDRGVGVGTLELELDVLVEPVEALVAADLGLCRPEHAPEGLL